MRGAFLQGRADAFAPCREALKPLSCNRYVVNRNARVEPVPDVKGRRDRVEGVGEECLRCGTSRAGMLQGSVQEHAAYPLPLAFRSDEKLGKKPQIAATPAEAEAHDLTRLFGDPQSGRIVAQREGLEVRRSHNCLLAKPMTFRQIVNAAGHELASLRQVLSSGRAVYNRHDAFSCATGRGIA